MEQVDKGLEGTNVKIDNAVLDINDVTLFLSGTAYDFARYRKGTDSIVLKILRVEGLNEVFSYETELSILKKLRYW
jgi:hypothetical protein